MVVVLAVLRGWLEYRSREAALSPLVLLPVLVTLYGPRLAVPMMGIAAVMANIARIIL